MHTAATFATLCCLLAACTHVLGQNEYLQHKLKHEVHARFLSKIPKSGEYEHEKHAKTYYKHALQQPDHFTVKRHSVENKVGAIYKRQLHEMDKAMESAKHHKFSYTKTVEKVQHAIMAVINEHPLHERKEIKRLLRQRFIKYPTGKTATTTTKAVRGRALSATPCKDAAANYWGGVDEFAALICKVNFMKTD